MKNKKMEINYKIVGDKVELRNIEPKEVGNKKRRFVIIRVDDMDECEQDIVNNSNAPMVNVEKNIEEEISKYFNVCKEDIELYHTKTNKQIRKQILSN